MRRREFLGVISAAAAAASPCHARAQTHPVVGILYSTAANSRSDGFFEALKDAGFLEGSNVRIERRAAGGAYERLSALAAELVILRPDVMVGFGTAAAKALAKSDSTIPIIFSMASDPVEDGLVQSLNRPGGNITGATSISTALMPKRLGLIGEFLHGEKTVGIVINPDNRSNAIERNELEVAVKAAGRKLEVFPARDEAEIIRAFALLRERSVGALIIAPDNFYYGRMQQFATLAALHSIPALGPLREFATEGGLMSYGANVRDVTHQAGILASKVLRGERIAELPVRQPTRFDLVVNLRAARALSIVMPPILLALADEVIE